MSFSRSRTIFAKHSASRSVKIWQISTETAYRDSPGSMALLDIYAGSEVKRVGDDGVFEVEEDEVPLDRLFSS